LSVFRVWLLIAVGLVALWFSVFAAIWFFLA
jgi:hypothetical protein